LAGCFNEPVPETFSLLVVAWVACLGRRTLHKVGTTFADLLAALRLHLGQSGWQEAAPEERNALLDWLFHYISTALG
jgi:hypothetical protein